MLNIIVTLVVAGTALWVYLDATGHKIGKLEGADGVFNMSAGAWAIVVLLLWIIAFPAYLIKRGDLLAKAKEKPVETPGRSSTAAVLGIVGALMVAGMVGLFAIGTLPDCDKPEVVALVEQLINDAPIIKASGLQVKLATPGEKSYDAMAERRVCRASITTPIGQEVIQYSVEWNDRSHSNIWVQIMAQGNSGSDLTPTPAQQPVRSASGKVELETGLVESMVLARDKRDRVGNSGKAIQAYMAEGYVNKRPNVRVDYTDYYLLNRPAKFLGYDLLIIEEEYMTKYIGCCVSPGVGAVVRQGTSLATLESFAAKNGCKVAMDSNILENAALDMLRKAYPSEKLASLSCRERDIER